MAVLHDGVRSAVRIGRSRKAEGRFLMDTDISWGQQVAVMFQIISTLTLELPSFLDALADIWGVSPDVQLDCEPWGHMDHSEGHRSCRSSDRTVAYVHELALMSREVGMPPSDGGRGGGGKIARSMSTLGHSSPIWAHRAQAHGMLSSHDAKGSIQMDMCSLGVVDLDFTPDARRLWSAGV